MYWLTENPWPLIILLVTSSAVAVLMMERRGGLVAVGLLLAAASVWMIEDSVVTPSETIQAELQSMLEAFKAGDERRVHAMISDAAPKLRETASEGISMVQLHSGFHLKDFQTEVAENGLKAVVHFRANGRAMLKSGGMEQQVATRWETTWQMEDSQWKLTAVRRLDVVSGDEIAILDAR